MSSIKGRKFGGSAVWKHLAFDPGLVQRSTPAVFSKDKAICRGSGTFTRMHCSSQANTEAMGFDLHLAFHEHQLKSPALQPADPERIRHRRTFKCLHLMGFHPQRKAVCQGITSCRSRVWWHSKRGP